MKLKKSPSYQRYPQDFIGSIDCRMMSMEEYGVFNWLLDYSWNATPQCFLPNDTESLAKLLGIPEKRFIKIWGRIQKKFELHIDPDTQKEFIYNDRLIIELRKQEDRREKLAENGRQGGRPKQSKRKAKNNQKVSETESKTEPNENQKESLTSSSSTSVFPPTPKGADDLQKPKRQPDAAFELFRDAYKAHYSGTPYLPSPRQREADFKHLHELREGLEVPNLEAPPDWSQTVANYLATPQEKHTLADVCVRYATFRMARLDRFKQPIAKATSGGVVL